MNRIGLMLLFVLGLTAALSLATDEVEEEADAMAKAIEQESKRVETESKSMVGAIEAKGKIVDSKEEEEKFEKASQRTENVMDSGEHAVEDKANKAEQMQNIAEAKMDALDKKVEEIANKDNSDKRSANKEPPPIVLGSGKMTVVPHIAGQANPRVTISYKAKMAPDPITDDLDQDVPQQSEDDEQDDFGNLSRETEFNEERKRSVPSKKGRPRMTISYNVKVPNERSIGKQIEDTENVPTDTTLTSSYSTNRKDDFRNKDMDVVYKDDGNPNDEDDNDDADDGESLGYGHTLLFEHKNKDNEIDVSDSPFDDSKVAEEDAIHEEHVKETPVVKTEGANQDKPDGTVVNVAPQKEGEAKAVKIQLMLDQPTKVAKHPISSLHRKQTSDVKPAEVTNNIAEFEDKEAIRQSKETPAGQTSVPDKTVMLNLMLNPNEGGKSKGGHVSLLNDKPLDPKGAADSQSNMQQPATGNKDDKTVKIQLMLSPLTKTKDPLKVMNDQPEEQHTSNKNNNFVKIKLLLNSLMKTPTDSEHHKTTSMDDQPSSIHLQSPKISTVGSPRIGKDGTMKIKLLLNSLLKAESEHHKTTSMDDQPSNMHLQSPKISTVGSPRIGKDGTVKIKLMLNPPGKHKHRHHHSHTTNSPSTNLISTPRPYSDYRARPFPLDHPLNIASTSSSTTDTTNTVETARKPKQYGAFRINPMLFQPSAASTGYPSPSRPTQGYMKRPMQSTDYGLGSLSIPSAKIGKLDQDAQNEMEEDTILRKLAKQTPREKAFQELESTRMSEEINRRLQQFQPDNLPDPKWSNWPSLMHKDIGKISNTQQLSMLSPSEVELMQTEFPDYAQREAFAEKSPQPVSVMSVKKTKVEKRKKKTAHRLNQKSFLMGKLGSKRFALLKRKKTA